MLKIIVQLHAFALYIVMALPSQAYAMEEHGTPITAMVTVSFKDSSKEFRPSSDIVEILGDAKKAVLVAIRGRTSTSTPSAKDDQLALARAASARSYLIARGVSPLKITINYASAGDFVADNTTAEGRLQNQRVEIELYFLPSYDPLN